MFCYENKLPTKGTVVVAVIDHSNKSDNCVYVNLPEFNNYSGVFYKSELPTRIKHHKKATKDMKNVEYIVCTVAGDAKYKQNGSLNVIDLSIKGVDRIHHEKIINRFKNIERIMKMVKFISIKTKIQFEDLLKKLNNIIKPIRIFDGVNIDTNNKDEKNKNSKDKNNNDNDNDNDNDDDGNGDDDDGNDDDNDDDNGDDNGDDEKTIKIDDLADTYLDYLRDPKKLIDIFDFDQDRVDKLLKIFKTQIHENNASSVIDFEIAVWSTAGNSLESTAGNSLESTDVKSRDPIFVIRDMFSHVMKKMKENGHSIDIRYVSAPRYQVALSDVKVENVDDVYDEFQKIVLEYFKENKVKGFDVKIDSASKVIVRGTVNITYPFEFSVY
jgi:translation initiation factor 2 alpha subunit (eIF-2alpha)